MRLKSSNLNKSLGLTGAVIAKWWRRTIEWHAVYFDPTTDTVHPSAGRRNVFIGWHEYMLMPIILRGNRNMLALASDHGDGEIISEAMRHLKWGVTRGSTTRGATTALLRLLREDRRHLNLTPDGPQGPRRTMSAGPIFLASKLDLPLVCVGYGYDRPWRMRSWDRFAVPRPFSRARAVFGPPLRIPSRLDRDELENYRRFFENLLNWLTEEAETWAESREHRAGSLPMLFGEAPAGMSRWNRSSAPKLPDSIADAWAALTGKTSRARAA